MKSVTNTQATITVEYNCFRIFLWTPYFEYLNLQSLLNILQHGYLLSVFRRGTSYAFSYDIFKAHSMLPIVMALPMWFLVLGWCSRFDCLQKYSGCVWLANAPTLRISKTDNKTESNYSFAVYHTKIHYAWKGNRLRGTPIDFRNLVNRVFDLQYLKAPQAKEFVWFVILRKDVLEMNTVQVSFVSHIH